MQGQRVGRVEWCTRMRVSLPPGVSERQRRELGGFARYCVKRLEHELGSIERWMVSLVSGSQLAFASVVHVRIAGVSVEARGLGSDPVLTIWDAMCHLEQALREQRSTPAPRRLSA